MVGQRFTLLPEWICWRILPAARALLMEAWVLPATAAVDDGRWEEADAARCPDGFGDSKSVTGSPTIIRWIGMDGLTTEVGDDAPTLSSEDAGVCCHGESDAGREEGRWVFR
ncbi:hypothetical protein ACLOJK_037019 [Asimina triloba]